MQSIGPRTARQVFGLIGRNVSYSWSPLIHNTAFDALGIPGVYTIFDIETPELVGDALKGARALGIRGFSVTIPYKKTVVPFLDELSPEAQSIRAVNTIVNEAGRLKGHNTDIAGFAAPLLPRLERIRGRQVCIFGNGGAALAAVEAFRSILHASSVLLFARDPSKADEMLDGYGHRGFVTPKPISDIGTPDGQRLLEGCPVVVNATPIGTSGRSDAGQSVVPGGRKLFRPGQVVYDMVYNPLETPLLADAKAAGAEAVSGIEMLIGQGAKAFALWTGREMPVDAVRESVLREIGRPARS